MASSHPIDQSHLIPPTTVEPNPMQMDWHEEEDENIDQLDSDSEPEEDPSASPTSGKKAPSRGEGKRKAGQTLLPVARLESIVQADGGTGSIALSKEATYVLSIATEEFIKRMAQAGHRQAAADRRTNVNYEDMSLTIQQHSEFNFLQDTVPHPTTLAEALELREQKEKEMLNVDPAVSSADQTMPAASSISQSGPSFTNASKAKGKARATNGVNGSASAAKKETKKKPKVGEKNGDSGGSTRTNSRASRGMKAAPRDEWPEVRPVEATGHPGGALLANGASPYRYRSQPQWAANTTTMRSDDFVEDPHSRRVVSPPRDRDEGDGWNGGQFLPSTTNANFIPSPTFARVQPNPGRTIYSQQP